MRQARGVRRRSYRFIPFVLAALLVAPVTGNSATRQAAAALRVAAPGTQISYPDARRQQQLMYLLAQDCGSCHGMSLQGGLGPALTPESLAGKPPAMLRDVILYGRPGTPMPPWKTFITERDAEWLVQVLVNGLGP